MFPTQFYFEFDGRMIAQTRATGVPSTLGTVLDFTYGKLISISVLMEMHKGGTGLLIRFSLMKRN